jgi:aryl-alcohol dehydrogenase-like predicted oxidoreductase
MEYTTLGRTGLKVSVAGLGCGGFSQLGLGTGKSEADAIGIIQEAVDLGVNLFDTAAAYGTEPILGRALRSVPRDRVVSSALRRRSGSAIRIRRRRARSPASTAR